jgi:CheY-like chemotaxis protein
MHAMPEGGELHIKTGQLNLSPKEATPLNLQVGDYVFINIRDNGIGMDNETKSKIFEPFYTTRGLDGTGLGLTQVYNFLNRCHGGIKVESMLGKGSSFTLYFPVSTHLDTANGLDAETDANKPDATHANILVVDDEAPLCNIAKQVLSPHGYHVVTAESGVQALEELEKQHFDLIISDIIMPNMDGYQLAEQVRMQYPQLPILLVSGYGHNQDMSNYDDALPLLEKPYQPARLVKKVGELLKTT